MAYAEFDFDDLPDLSSALTSLEYALEPPKSATYDRYLRPLRQLAEELRESLLAIENTTRLAKGIGDLAVVLLEPGDCADYVSYPDMFASSDTLRHLDEILLRSSKGKRNVENTCVIDVRPFRSNKARMKSPEIARLADDEKAYAAFEQTMELLEPEVVLVLQCGTSDVRNDLAKRLSSSVRKSGDVSLCHFNNGKQTIVVWGFHPSYARRYVHGELEGQLRLSMLELTVLTAINAVAGRRIRGFGINNLQLAIENNGPTLLFQTDRVSITFRAMNEDVVAPESVLEFFKSMPGYAEVSCNSLEASSNTDTDVYNIQEQEKEERLQRTFERLERKQKAQERNNPFERTGAWR